MVPNVDAGILGKSIYTKDQKMGLKRAAPYSDLKILSKTENHLNGWYVIYTKSKYEKKVQEELVSKEYTSYLPLIQKTSIWSDRRKIIEMPLFPSYVFVYLNDIRIYYKLLQIKGVVNFIKFENKFVIVKELEIDRIRQIVNNCSQIELTDLKTGEKKTILSGPLSGLECEIIAFKGKYKIIVNIESLKQNIIAEIPAEQLHL
jgi:transcription antitermination factor NusG